MDIETLYLELMADINDALKSDVPPPDKIALFRRAKLKAEQRYAELATFEQVAVELDGQP